jgi:hypothetical protein
MLPQLIRTYKSIDFWDVTTRSLEEIYCRFSETYCLRLQLAYSSKMKTEAVYYSSQSQSYIKTDGQPASLSWNKVPIWGLRPDLYYMCDSYGLVLVGRPL